MANADGAGDLTSEGNSQPLVAEADTKDRQIERFVLEQRFSCAKVRGLVRTSGTGGEDDSIYVRPDQLVEGGGSQKGRCVG